MTFSKIQKIQLHDSKETVQHHLSIYDDIQNTDFRHFE